MANANILNTRTINYLELIGNGRIHRVPPYQRDYSWEEDQWEDLWNDVLDLERNPRAPHYMGAVVVEAKSDREFQVIDGQQRLATLSLLALAVIKNLGDLAGRGIDARANGERAQELRNRFIGERDPASLVESSRLSLNQTDNAFYQDYLVPLRAPLNPRGLVRSNRLLWDCFRYFDARIRERNEQQHQDGMALARLLSETVARRLLFILITVEDDVNAYTVFETLNARGLELTTTDLLKNYLFSRVRVASDLEALQRRWRALVGVVTQERFPEFLRYHLLCELPAVRSQRLFKLIRDRVNGPEDVFSLMAALESRAELFAAVLDPDHGYWIERPEARLHIRELGLFNVRQMMPLLFAVWERFEPADFARVLKLVATISFRFSVIARRNSHPLEPAYHGAAKAVLLGEAPTPAAVFERLRPIYVDDEGFRAAFESAAVSNGGRSAKLAKYILSRLEHDASGRALDFETDPATIEHILPQNPAQSWASSFPENLWAQCVDRLGNLALLEPSLNRRVGNEDYPEKMAAYTGSAYVTTRRIAEIAPRDWTPALLDSRQRVLAARAAHLWRSDFV